MRNQVVSHEEWLKARPDLRATDVLCLAATPTFALMALMTGVLGGGPLEAFCAAAQGAPVISGMVLMYLLMSIFHAAPWLKLVAGWRSGVGAREGSPELIASG
ncbi:hypothetical protein [Phreatobacter stygius]|uniref:hypothetical protein n=1 Tax=Phreatobacter stygius TaxID=1940610 RepID=UPI001B8C9ACD|nr:hypothetical protein [Phreatobacter stygius]